MNHSDKKNPWLLISFKHWSAMLISGKIRSVGRQATAVKQLRDLTNSPVRSKKIAKWCSSHAFQTVVTADGKWKHWLRAAWVDITHAHTFKSMKNTHTRVRRIHTIVFLHSKHIYTILHIHTLVAYNTYYYVLDICTIQTTWIYLQLLTLEHILAHCVCCMTAVIAAKWIRVSYITKFRFRFNT